MIRRAAVFVLCCPIVLVVLVVVLTFAPRPRDAAGATGPETFARVPASRGGAPMIGTPSPDPTLDPQIVTDAKPVRDALPDLGGKGAFLVPTTTGQLVYRGYTKSGTPRNPTVALLLADPTVPARRICLEQIQLGLWAFGSMDKMDNTMATRTVTLGGVTATLVVAGPSEYAPEGSLRLTWEQGGMGYVLSAWGLPEEQVLRLANALRPLP